MSLKGKFSVQAWDENPQHELGNESKISRATVKQLYSGDVSGESTIEYTMYYPDQSTSTFIGFEYFTGTISDTTGDKSGTLIFKHNGKFENGVATSQFKSLNGTADLEGLNCSGTFKTLNHGEAEYEFTIL